MLVILDRLRGCHLLHDSIAALDGYGDKVDEAFRMRKVFVADNASGLAILRCSFEARPERGAVKNLAEGVVICLCTGRETVEWRRRVAWLGGGGGSSSKSRVEASLALRLVETAMADPGRCWLLCARKPLEHRGWCHE